MKKRTLFVCFLIFTLCVFHSLIPSTVLAQDDASLAQQVFDIPENKDTLLRDDVKALLPELLNGLKNAGDDLDIPETINLAITLINAGSAASLQALAAGQGVTLTDDHIALLADADVQALLQHETTIALLSLKGAELASGLDELSALIAAAPDDGGTTPDPTVPDPTVPDPTVPDPTVPDPTVPDPTTPPVVPPGPPVDLTPSVLNGQSRLGGLSLNRVHGRAFIRNLIAAAGLSREMADAQVENVVDAILAQVPQGFLPKKQIKQALTAEQPTSIFAEGKDSQLDFENFGNAIAPDLSEAIYTNVKNSTKFLTSQNLNLYVRVPSTLTGGSVQFMLDGKPVKTGQRITPAEFQADTIPYTFRLEESLAATNLPAWPDLKNQLFSGVVLRYSQTGLDGEYIAVDMDPVNGDNGVVWESKIGIIPKDNTHYYFEVTLAEPVMLEVLNPEAIYAAIDSPDGTHSLNATNTYTIERWAMPDPKNLQLDDRGIFNALFTPDVVAAVIPIAASALTDPTAQIPGRQLQELQSALLRSANDLFTKFESDFDPLLASVFSVPDIDIATESLWYANIGPAMDNGGYGLADTGMPSKLDAIVLNANGDKVDQITVDFTVDTQAPTADIAIGPAENATGYWNKDNAFVATAPADGTASLVNIRAANADGVGQGQGYLIYQLIDLDVDGNPEGTWLPLTVENSMVASDLWKIVQEQLEGITDPQVQLVAGLSIDALLGLLQADIAGLAGPFLEDFGIKLSDEQINLLGNLLGASIEDLNLIPVTFDPTRDMTIPIQGENIPLLVGDYGIRAMGIDTLFNVGSYVPPTRLRVVSPVWDRTSVTFASLGDLNGDGDADESYESGTIFKNATDVTLTVSINERTVHPGTVMVQYMDAAGEWQNIGELTLAEAEGLAGDTLTIDWNVTDFDALVMAGDTVAVRTVTTNGLQLTDESEPFTINLDADVHPVDPEVLVVDVDDNSIVMTNPDSGAPQGTISLDGYSPRRTVPATSSIRIEAKRMNDEAWAGIGTVEVNDPNGMDGEATAPIEFKGKTIGDVHVYEMPMIGTETSPHINPTSSYLKWIITVDTTLLEDSITVDSPGARDASMDDNRYMVRAYAVGNEGSDISDVLEGDTYTEMFSVDNDDDVAPLGPTNVAATSVDAVDSVFEDNGDGTYTVGGLVDKYDPEVNSPVITLTITPTAVRNTYASVKLLTSLPDGAIIGDITETAEGSGVFTVTIDVGTLMDDDEFVHNDKYLQERSGGIYTDYDLYTFNVHALAYDKAMPYDDITAADEMFLEYGNVQADDYDGDEITVNVQNSYRPDPGVLAISVENSDGMTNPDSGAPQGELTLNAYTHGLTSPPTEQVRFEAKRLSDTTWERVAATVEPPVAVDESDLSDITTGLVQITGHEVVSGGQTELDIPAEFQKWTVVVDTRKLALEGSDNPDDTIKLDDTIKRGDAAQRDASLDDNQYQVRAISLTPKDLAHPEYDQRDGVEASFSLDNDDDVPPLGPTNITDVADVAGSITADEDGSYTVGGIVDPTVESPVAIFTIEPTADPNTYVDGKTVLVQTDADGTMTETDGSLEDGSITIDVGQLANGTYMYHALTADAFGNVQVQGEADLPSPIVTVHVINFRVSDITDLAVTAVDGVMVDGELPETIPLRESISVSFNVNNGSLAVEDLTGVLVDGHAVTFTAGSDAENAFSLMADKLSEVADGWYTPHGQVTKRNGSVTFALAMINLDNTGPIITTETPGEGVTVNDLPTLLAAINDGELGVGVSADNTVNVSLARIRPGNESQEKVAINVDQSMVEQDLDSVVYTRIDSLAGGAYQFTIQVSDSLGNIGEGTVTFAVEGLDPTVVITAPAGGQTIDHSPANITGLFAGGGDVSITKFTINDADMTPDVEGNNFTYIPNEALGDGDYTVDVEVTDGSGLTAQTSLTFTVELPVPTASITTPAAGQVYAHGMPVITGEFSGADPVSGTLSIDGESVNEVSGNDFTYTPTVALSDGAHTVSIEVTDANGRMASATINFTVDIPGPTVAIHGPAKGQMYDHGKPSISGEFSGVATPVTLSLTVNGEAAEAIVSDNGFSYTPADGLGDGEYTVVAVATDANGKTAKATAIFSVELPVPTASITTPAAGQVYAHGMPVITGEFSGADPVSGTLSIDGESVNEISGNDFTYTPTVALSDGAHMVSIEVTDANGRTASAAIEFTVDIPGPTVAIHGPAKGQMYDHGKPSISGEFSGVATPVTLSLTVNGEAAEAIVSDNGFSYTPADGLGDGEYTVVAVATDANGKTAKATAIFSVELPVPTASITTPAAGQVYDHGMPAITGEFSGADPVSGTLSIDGESVNEVSGNDFTYTPTVALSDGAHTVSIEVTDANGRMASATINFTVDIPGPTVAIHGPAKGQMYDHGKPSISGEFSGVATPVTLSLTVNGEAAEAVVSDNGFSYTPADGLGDGEYTVVAVATDANGKTVKATAIFSVELPVPTASITTPAAGQVYAHGMPVITGEFSGADPVSGTLSIDGESVNEVSGNDFTYTPTVALSDGAHTVSIEVTDANGRMASATIEFTVDIPGPNVAIHSPANGQIYDHSMPVINVDYSGVAEPVTLSVTVNDEAVTENDDGTYSPATVLDDGEYTVIATATDANGKTAKASAIFSVSLPVPTVTIQSPVEGLTYNNGDVVIAGAFTGVAPVAVKLSIDGADVEADVNGNEFNHALADALSHGEHTIAVEITDANGKTAQATTVFIVDIPGPSVAILSPAPGQTYDHGTPVIRAEFSGMTDVTVTTFTINGEDAEAEVEDNQFTFTPELGDGEHTVVVEVSDANGKSARASVVFSVAIPKDTTPPVISAHSPTGVVQLNKADVIAGNMAITISADISDQESEITSVKYLIDNTPPTSSYPVERAASKFEITESFSPGPHSIKLIVVSEGGTKEFSWQFVLDVDQTAPVISSITPSGTVHAGLPTISASANDESGVESISIVVMDSGGEEVAGETADDSEDRNNEGITRLDFHPEAPLTEGTYAIEVRATDAFGNSSTLKGGFSVDFDTSAPFITTSSPQDGARLMIKHNEDSIAPTISITIGDAETGVNVDSIRLSIEAPGRDKADLISLEEGKERSATQVIYTPGSPEFTGGFMVPGEYTVILEVSDNAQQQGNVSEENDGAREANTAVYQFSFFVEKEAGPILAKPINFPNPFAQNTRISFGLNRMSTVSIVIYDSTLRPVRTLRDNVVLSAGDYTGNNGIGWDGKTSGGEDLARGIYFCEIIVTDGFEPEYAILKLALTR